MTLVTSPWSASTCRSNINVAWSAYEAGTPTGRSRSGNCSLVVSASAFWMRRSTSRTVFQILVDPGAIVRSELPLQARDVIAHPIEQTGPSPQRGAAVGGAAAFAEQALEDDARVGFGRKRRRRRRPREVVLVDARVAVVALAHRLEQIHRQLQRRQQRLLADLLRGDLVDRRAQVVVGAFGPFRLGRAQERGVRRGMRAGIRVLQLQVA